MDLVGEVFLHIDDFLGCHLSSNVVSVMSVKCFLEELLGPGSSNVVKRVLGVRKVVTIGWEFDLDGGPVDDMGRTVGTLNLSAKNLDKFMSALATTSLSGGTSRDCIERLASYMSRYSGVVLPQLRQFAGELYCFIHGLKRNILKPLSRGA